MDQPELIADGPGKSRPTSSWRDAAISRVLERAFAEGTRGRLDVLLPSGRHAALGHEGPNAARVVVKSYAAFWRLASRGAIGLAESYMRAEIETPDLGAVLRFCLGNYSSLEKAGGGIIKTRLLDALWHHRRDNTLRGSRRNIAAHYDLGNNFYKLWLDPGMTYSSAIYRDGIASLEAAQEEKLRVVLDQLNLKPGCKLLEIGCGWGSLAEKAQERGAEITGLTLSIEQLAYTKERLTAADHAGHADIRLQDYRAVEGQFDAIASVEMIEAVGEAHWPRYFEVIRDRLRPGGAAAIQAITIEERFFDSYRRHPDFIQRYIFPGGMLPTIERMRAEAAKAGLTFDIVERFGHSYALTLSEWRSRFRAAWPDIHKLGFDERFRRMWEYYLTYCEVGFESGDIDVGIYSLRHAP